MTEEQVRTWQKRRNEAKEIKDPEARQKALDFVYDLKDDMQLDCQRKMADRIKDLVASDEVQREEIAEVKIAVEGLQQGFEADHETVQGFREGKLRVSGALLLLKWLGYLLAAGGGSLVTWFVTAANKVVETQ